MEERGKGVEQFHDILSKKFCLKVPKVFKGEPFCAVFQKISNSENYYE